jgi:hypothetical protein
MGPVHNSQLPFNGSAAPSPVQVSMPRAVLSLNEEVSAHVHVATGSDKACNTPLMCRLAHIMLQLMMG